MYEVTIGGRRVAIYESEGLFSPSHADKGTLAMLSHVTPEPGQRVLDLGCGCGLVGIYAAMICGEENAFLCDVDPEAVRCARLNAQKNGLNLTVYESDGLEGVKESGFDLILSNPPYQSDFAVAKHFIEKGFNRLVLGGKMLMVTKRREWYRNKFISIFGGVRVREIDGYYVFEAEKRQAEYAGKKKSR